MARFSVTPITDQSMWDEFIATRPEANFLQSWQWGEFHAALGKTIKRCGFYDGDQLQGIMLTIVEPARRGRYLTVPGGPLMNWKNKNATHAFAIEVKRQARQSRCVFVRCRPQLPDSPEARAIFAAIGFRDAPIYMHAELTHELNLAPAEDELLANMRKGTRYEVKKAIKEGITLTASSDPADIEPFYQLQLETAKRQGFVPFSLKFFQTQFATFARDNQTLLYTAKLGDELLAQAFIIFYGPEAVYHYGASTEAGRKYPGAYLIQWEAIKEAKRRGLARYNFYGVAPAGDAHHRFAGVSTFKRGFSGTDVQYLHAQDLVINWPFYLINLTIERARKLVRHV